MMKERQQREMIGCRPTKVDDRDREDGQDAEEKEGVLVDRGEKEGGEHLRERPRQVSRPLSSLQHQSDAGRTMMMPLPTDQPATENALPCQTDIDEYVSNETLVVRNAGQTGLIFVRTKLGKISVGYCRNQGVSWLAGIRERRRRGRASICNSPAKGS
jgi:hypothetical protein